MFTFNFSFDIPGSTVKGLVKCPIPSMENLGSFQNKDNEFDKGWHSAESRQLFASNGNQLVIFFVKVTQQIHIDINSDFVYKKFNNQQHSSNKNYATKMFNHKHSPRTDAFIFYRIYFEFFDNNLYVMIQG